MTWPLRWVALIGLVGCCFACGGRTRVTADAGREQQPLEMRLTAAPPYLDVHLRNLGDGRQAVLRGIATSFDFLAVRMVGPAGHEFEFRPVWMRDSAGPKIEDLAPGEETVLRVEIPYWVAKLGGSTTPSGRYQVFATYEVPADRVWPGHPPQWVGRIEAEPVAYDLAATADAGP